MRPAIDCLKHKREELLSRIKAGEQELIDEKVEIEQAIAWLTKITTLQLGRAQNCRFITLPDMKTGYSEYHLMNDCESGNIEHFNFEICLAEQNTNGIRQGGEPQAVQIGTTRRNQRSIISFVKCSRTLDRAQG